MNRLGLALLSLPLVACFGGERAATGKCPAGETCSPLTPNGLWFVGADLVGQLLLSGPAPTAVGGTQEVALQYDRGDGIRIALDLPFTADDDGGRGVRVDHTSGSVVTVRGAGSRTNYLRILDATDGTLFDRKELTGASLDTVELVAADLEMVPPDAQLAWATGAQKIGVALKGQVQESSGPVSERLVDTSMQLALSGAQRTAWDTLYLATAAPGTYPVSVTAGDKPAANLDLIVVDHADAIAPLQDAPTTIPPNGSVTVCFQATSSGRFIVGLPWTFEIDGVAVVDAGLIPNCVLVSTHKTTGSVSVAAAAGGQMVTMSLAVAAMARESRPVMSPAAPAAPIRSPLGDRAAL